MPPLPQFLHTAHGNSSMREGAEGEQAVIALADSSRARTQNNWHRSCSMTRSHSLDYIRLRELVERIVALSEQRPVIIFTHNILVHHRLLSHFETAEPTTLRPQLTL